MTAWLSTKERIVKRIMDQRRKRWTEEGTMLTNEEMALGENVVRGWVDEVWDAEYHQPRIEPR